MNRPRLSIGRVIAVVVAAVACALIIVPALPHRSSGGSAQPARTFPNLSSELSTIDPRMLVPSLPDFPLGTRVQSHGYVSTATAAQMNGTSLALLQRSGREIGFDRDFLVPGYGDIDVEIVRFRTHSGMRQAYSYFLRLPGLRGFSRPNRTDGIGEQAAIVIQEGGAFLEFMRGRYYVVVTTIPAGPASLNFIGRLSHAVDQRIQTYRGNA